MRAQAFREAFVLGLIAQSGPDGCSAAAIGKVLQKYGSFVDRETLGLQIAMALVKRGLVTVTAGKSLRLHP
jgi:hypothetical protein